MPHSAITKASIRQLTFAWISMFVLILLLLCLGQILLTVANAQENQARAQVVTLDEQELRTQDMFYNVIILQSPGTAPGTTYMSITASLASEEVTWEQVGNRFYDTLPEFPASAQALFKSGKVNFLAMQGHYRSVLATEHKDNPAPILAVRPAIDQIYLEELPYIQMLIKVNSAVSKEANAYAATVRNVELLISLLCALVVLCEAFFVARPSIKQFQIHMDLLAKTLQSKEPGH